MNVLEGLEVVIELIDNTADDARMDGVYLVTSITKKHMKQLNQCIYK